MNEPAPQFTEKDRALLLKHLHGERRPLSPDEWSAIARAIAYIKKLEGRLEKADYLIATALCGSSPEHWNPKAREHLSESAPRRMTNGTWKCIDYESTR